MFFVLSLKCTGNHMHVAHQLLPQSFTPSQKTAETVMSSAVTLRLLRGDTKSTFCVSICTFAPVKQVNWVPPDWVKDDTSSQGKYCPKHEPLSKLQAIVQVVEPRENTLHICNLTEHKCICICNSTCIVICMYSGKWGGCVVFVFVYLFVRTAGNEGVCAKFVFAHIPCFLDVVGVVGTTCARKTWDTKARQQFRKIKRSNPCPRNTDGP